MQAKRAREGDAKMHHGDFEQKSRSGARRNNPRTSIPRQASRSQARPECEGRRRLGQRVFSRFGTLSRSRYRALSSSRCGTLPRLLPRMLVVLAILVVLAAGYGALSGVISGSGATSTGTAGISSPHSTVSSEWTKGVMPYLYQTDGQWASSPYAGATVGDSGCGPTCMSMVYIYLTGKKDKNPAQMAALSEQNGFVEGGMTTWVFMTEGARKLGLSSEELPADESTIRGELAVGHPIIVSVSAGDFTTTGHFIVLVGTDSLGRILIRDPNSPERSSQAWDLSRILSQTRNLWAISLAAS